MLGWGFRAATPVAWPATTSKIVIPVGHPPGTEKVLAFDGQVGAFAVGDTVVGGTSGATAKIIAQDDLGTTGVLYLNNVVPHPTGGSFQDNEALKVGGTTKADANGTAVLADPIPFECDLGVAMVKLDTIAGGATQVEWYISEDVAGDVPITPAQTDTIKTGKATSTDGSVVRLLNMPWKFADDMGAEGLRGRLFVVIALNAGTANARARIVGSQIGMR